MSGLKLDTSGRVAGTFEGLAVWYEWDDLLPFDQGYIEAAFESVEWPDPAEGFDPSGAPRFSDVAPATLAAMLEDCERFVSVARGLGIKKLEAPEGRYFWIGRNAGTLNGPWGAAFPPVALYLADDGKIHQREAR